MKSCVAPAIIWAFGFALMLIFAGPASAQQPNWLRFYFGGQIGYSFDYVSLSTSLAALPPDNGNAESLIGGVQGGVNFYRQGSFVAGVVLDFNWLSAVIQENGSETTRVAIDFGDDFIQIVDRTTNTSVVFEIAWKSSMRSKAGYLINPNTLLYVTGGPAFAQIDTSLTTTQTTASDSAIALGVVIGFGAETMITPNIGAFVQALHYEFLTQDFQLGGSSLSIDLNETVVQAGVSFYFN